MKLGNPSNYFVHVFPRAWQEEPETAPLYEGIYSVRLNAVLPVFFVPDASAVGRFAFGAMPSAVFYVSPAEYAGYAAELEELAEIASDANPRLRRNDLLDRAVIQFVERQVLGSPLLAPWMPTPSAGEEGRGPRESPVDQRGLRTTTEPAARS